MNPSIHDWNAPREASLEVHLLGLADFDACLYLQERLAAEVALRNDVGGYLLLCEHLPLLTVGREGSRSHIACTPEDLVSRQIQVRWLNRGGGCIVHMRGQLAAYPILPLDRRKLGLATYRERLEQALVDVCGELRVPAWRDPAYAGVWCRGGQIAHVGVAVRSWVSTQGVYLNVCPRSDALQLVRSPRGRETSLAAQRQLPTAMAPVRESLIRHLASRLDYSRFHVYTGHPLLRPVRRVLAYA